MAVPLSMQHWNGDQIAAIDTETTGTDAEMHELIQIAIVPLDSEFKPRQGILPFNIYLRPDYPELADKEAMSINKIAFSELARRGFDREKAKDLLFRWYEQLNLPMKKYGQRRCTLIPLGQNYVFDYSFIIKWLGNEMYYSIFSPFYRDTMRTALILNDLYGYRAEKIPFPKVNLKYLASQLKVETYPSHDALQDCLATAAVYRRMVRLGLPIGMGKGLQLEETGSDVAGTG